MLTTLTIRGFKSLRDVTLDLGTVNVFIGANGSGKTAILESLGMLGCGASGHVDDTGLLDRGVRPGVPSLFKSSFADSKPPATIQLTATADIMERVATYALSLENSSDRPARMWKYRSENLDVGAGRSRAFREQAEVVSSMSMHTRGSLLGCWDRPASTRLPSG